MKIKTIKTKAFISIEIILFFFAVSISLKIYKEYLEKIQIYNTFKNKKEKLLILKKYLCSYIKKNKSLPPINNFNEIDFNKDLFLKKIPTTYQKSFKIYEGNMNNNEILYLVFDYKNNKYKIVIYGHDINIFTGEELKKFFNKEKKSIVLIDNEDKSFQE